MDKDQTQAHAVIEALQEFERRIDAILGRLEGKNSVSREEKQKVQTLLTSLKRDLKAAAKHNPVNKYESVFLSPAVKSAAANLTVAVNSHPISSNWYSCLYGVHIDISHMLGQLKQEFPSA